jgi:chromosome segregation ATPase
VQIARLVEGAQGASTAAEAGRAALHGELQAVEVRCNTASQKLLRSTESNHTLRKELAAVTREAEIERSMAQETIEDLEDELDALQRELDACKGRSELTSASGALSWHCAKV